MPTLSASVGQGGTNKKHDVSLVQAMLRIVKNPKGQPYVTFDYDGQFTPGGATFKAIKAFQEDQTTLDGPPKEVVGKVEPNSKTFQKMTQLLPADRQDLRTLENQKLVYVAGTQAEANAAANRVTNDPDFTTDFKTKLADLIRKFYTKFGIVLNVIPPFANGGFRTFDEQQKEFKDGDSDAGPGESYHNWGNGADVGMDGFAWLKGNGAVIIMSPKSTQCNPVGDGPWLTELTKVNSTAVAELWNLRDLMAAGSLFPTSLENDKAHLQTFSDATVSMVRSLAEHLSQFGRMWWEHKPGAYWCNYGLADQAVKFKVGTASKIWDRAVNVDETSLATALNQAAKRRAAGPLPDYEEAIYTAIVGLTPSPPAVWKASDIKKAHCDRMRDFFHADFETVGEKEIRAQWRPLKADGSPA
jgi:hypothetical protein